MNEYEMTIGIECHVQLATASKLFSGSDNDARDQEPNAVTSPIDFGLPGMLPVLNRHAVELAVRAGKALNSDIARVSRFDRKHYFYPDLPKGYQISQMYEPIILAGYVDVPIKGGDSVKVRIHHAHIEEDAGKLTHLTGYSLVDLNRAGTPLIEIVSEPDIHSAEAARAYAEELHHLMVYAGVTNGDLYHGNMRFDVNISVAKKGATELGTRAEVKNLNSFKSVERAALYEFQRQVALLERGEKVVQETRGWNDAKAITASQRSKEDAQDYRYMPDPDIPPIVLSAEEITDMQADMPTLPGEYRQQWASLELDHSVVGALLAVPVHAKLIGQIQSEYDDTTARRVAHWFASVSVQDETEAVAAAENQHPAGYVALSEMVGKKELSSTAAKEIFQILYKKDIDPRAIAEEKNLLQVSDEGAVRNVVREVLADPIAAQSIEDIKAGQEKAIGFLVGQVMKRSQGKANPSMAQTLLREELGL